MNLKNGRLIISQAKDVILENRAIAETRASRMRDNKADKIMLDERLQNDESE